MATVSRPDGGSPRSKTGKPTESSKLTMQLNGQCLGQCFAPGRCRGTASRRCTRAERSLRSPGQLPPWSILRRCRWWRRGSHSPGGESTGGSRRALGGNPAAVVSSADDDGMVAGAGAVATRGRRKPRWAVRHHGGQTPSLTVPRAERRRSVEFSSVGTVVWPGGRVRREQAWMTAKEFSAPE